MTKMPSAQRAMPMRVLECILGRPADKGSTTHSCGFTEEKNMTLCPIALAAGCQKCPAFSVCPLKGVIGDYKKPEETAKAEAADKGKK